MNTVGPVHATPGGSTSGPATATIPTATLLTTTACHLCEDAHAELARRAARGELTLEVVPLDSAEGRALLQAYRPAMFPLVLVDGRLLGHGRLSRRRLDAALRARRAG